MPASHTRQIRREHSRHAVILDIDADEAINFGMRLTQVIYPAELEMLASAFREGPKCTDDCVFESCCDRTTCALTAEAVA